MALDVTPDVDDGVEIGGTQCMNLSRIFESRMPGDSLNDSFLFLFCFFLFSPLLLLCQCLPLGWTFDPGQVVFLCFRSIPQ